MSITMSSCSVANDTFMETKLKNSSGILEPTAKQLSITKQVVHLDSETYRCAWSPDGKYFAVNGFNHQIYIFDAVTNHKNNVLHLNETTIQMGDVAYSPDGKYLAGGNSIISIWDAKSMKLLREINPGTDIYSLIFSPDSKIVATTGIVTANKIYAYNVETGALLYSIKLSPGLINSNIVFTPDGHYLVASRTKFLTEDRRRQTGESDKYFTYLDFYDAKNGQLVKSITPVHVMSTTALAVSPDSHLVATGTNTKRTEYNKNPKTGVWEVIDNQDPIRLWDIESSKLVKEFGPLESHVSSLAFSPDGKYLASCFKSDQPDIFWLWDVKSGRLLEKVSLPTKAFGTYYTFKCAFSPDSKHIAIPVVQDIYLISIGN